MLPYGGLAAAVFAGAVEHDFVVGDAHRDAAAELFNRALEVGVGEWGYRSAVVADEVVVVFVAGADRFIAGHCLANLDFLDEVKALEFVEDAVDAGASDGPVGAA